jgi:hypothetical protein
MTKKNNGVAANVPINAKSSRSEHSSSSWPQRRLQGGLLY